MEVKILFEDESLFIVIKPPGMPSQAERSTAVDMVSYLKNLLAARDKTKNPYIAVVHRLDRPVGGVMVYAKTLNAAAALSRQMALRIFGKEYLAVVAGTLPNKQGHLEDRVLKNGKTNLSQVVLDMDTANAKKAVLDYEILEEKVVNDVRFSLIKIKLLTGRHHQIRVQMAHAGAPVAGDSRYGAGTQTGHKEMGLFSRTLEFKHPVTGKEMHFSALPDASPFRMFDSLKNIPE